MNIDSETTAALRKLLALKRLEQPPPGYFDQLAGNIVCRLELGEGESNFWDRLAAIFAIRPALAYGIVLTMCGALAGATILSLKEGATEASPQIASVESWSAANSAQAGRVHSLHVASWTGTENDGGDSSPAHSLFQPPRYLAVPAAYRSGN